MNEAAIGKYATHKVNPSKSRVDSLIDGLPKRWQSLLGAFIAHIIAERGLSHHTVDSYKHDLVDYLSFLSERNVDEPSKCTYELILVYALRLRSHNLSPSTIQRRLSAITTFHRFLVRDGFANEDPTANLERPKRQLRLPKYLDHETVERLLEQPSEGTLLGLRDKAFLELLYASGARVSELINLNLSDVNLETGFIRCIGKGSKERIIPIGRKAIEALKAYLTLSRPALDRGISGGALFLSHHGRRLCRTAAFKIIKRYGIALGLSKPPSPHVIRHTFATHMLKGGADLRSIQELLGHANIATTQIYTHVTGGQLRQSFIKAHPRATAKDDVEQKLIDDNEGSNRQIPK
ncbi:MAG: site-specific tyrosine recombinase XerD [Armatimonadota bacterium]|nr:site-specific tyrosine recombinase XerD [Armatimonadota bacterium]MCX7777336.1 site-specific tyrosine recombinase XerD [Armatimonadota bacterium]MDW8025396.1 site-specific tyrosine recombinase XerD [Armatimonadota bacterium]